MKVVMWAAWMVAPRVCQMAAKRAARLAARKVDWMVGKMVGLKAGNLAERMDATKAVRSVA